MMHDGTIGLLGQHDAEVGSRHRLTRTTLGREDADDLAPIATLVCQRRSGVPLPRPLSSAGLEPISRSAGPSRSDGLDRWERSGHP